MQTTNLFRSLLRLCAIVQLLLFAPRGVGGKLEDESFAVEFEVDRLAGLGSSSGSFVVQFSPAWAPKGVERVKELVLAEFFDECRFFRVIDGFMAQFGIHGDPSTMNVWSAKKIKDDKRVQKIGNTRGRVTFAMAGPSTRTSQLFINFKDNSFLDGMGFTPVGEVISGMDVVDRIFKIGEGAPKGPGPAQGAIQREGNKYLERKFPTLTYIKSARLRDPATSVSSASQVETVVEKAAAVVTQVQCELTTGNVLIDVHPEWAPRGAERFLELIRAQYYDGCALFRAIPGFLVQFGIGANKTQREVWRRKPTLKDDPLRPDVPITFGTMAYAGSGRNSRTTQVWIAFEGKHPGLGKQPWETPFAQVVGQESLDAIRRINTEYGDRVDQGRIWSDGYAYLSAKFPRLDYIKMCSIVAPATTAAPTTLASSTPNLQSSDSPTDNTGSHAEPQLRGAGGSAEIPADGMERSPDEAAKEHEESALGPLESALVFAATLGVALCLCRCRVCASILSKLGIGNPEKQT